MRRILCLIVAAGMVARAVAVEPPKSFLEIDFTFSGRGSWPDLEALPASQDWTLARSYLGYVEVTVESESVPTPSGPKARLKIRPKAGGISTVVGTLDDLAVNSATDWGEGASSMEYSAREEWYGRRNLEARDLGAPLELDTEKGVWSGNIGLGSWESLLAEQVQYRGMARMMPGPGEGGGFAEPWEFFTTDPRSQQTDGRGVFTRYHPGSPYASSFPLAQVPATLSAAYYGGQWDVPIPRPSGAPGSWSMNASLRWTLRDQLPEVELQVLGFGYEAWRPSLAEDKSAGRPLLLAAGVVSPKKEPLDRIRVKKFTWTLHETSREPGIALNFPPRELAKTDPDLRIEGIPTSDDGQKGEDIPEQGVLTSGIDLVPYDWGGWSTLRVEAELEDGRILKGEMQVAPGDKRSDIPIPKRSDGSKVASGWLKEQRSTGLSDESDQDPRPTGKPGADGDGLTVYEEYRGFYVGGEHRSTDPWTKDLFVANEGGSIGKGAVRRFRHVSQLEVHLPMVNEFDPFPEVRNQINFNRSQGPTRGPQGGLWLVTAEQVRGTYPPGSRPRTHGRVRVPAALPDLPRRVANTDTIEQVVMQEMFRALGVERPGPDDSMRRFELVVPPPGSDSPPEILLLPNTRVVVLDYFGDDFARKWHQQIAGPLDRIPHRIPAGLSPTDTQKLAASQRSALIGLRWLVGEKGGAHSGPDDCVMRDWFADIYRTRFTSSDGRPVYRLVDPPRGAESPGRVLGNTRKGTGVNAPDRQPEPRYGDSSVAQPANRQMVVSDSAP